MVMKARRAPSSPSSGLILDAIDKAGPSYFVIQRR